MDREVDAQRARAPAAVVGEPLRCLRTIASNYIEYLCCDERVNKTPHAKRTRSILDGAGEDVRLAELRRHGATHNNHQS